MSLKGITGDDDDDDDDSFGYWLQYYLVNANFRLLF